MDNQYKYALYDGKGTTEVLLDMINDPKETKNIAQLSQHKAVRDRMNKALTDYMKSRNLVLNPDVTKMPKGGDEGSTALAKSELLRKVYVNQGKITISDIESKISVSAYNLNGMMLWRATTQDRTFISPSMSKGIYFLYIEENGKQVGQVILID